MNLQEEIRKVAYELYEKSGRIGGREVENWVEAERIVMARHAHKQTTGRPKAQSGSEPAKKVVAKPGIKKAAAKTAEGEPKKTKPAVKKAGAKKTLKPVK